MTREPEEDDLTTEELLSMWEEAEPVTVVATRFDLDAFPWMRQYDTAAFGLRSNTPPIHGSAVRPRSLTTGDKSDEELARSA